MNEVGEGTGGMGGLGCGAYMAGDKEALRGS